MALNIKNHEVELLAREVSKMTGVSKTEAIRVALKEKREHLVSQASRAEGLRRFQNYLQAEVWPHLAPGTFGKMPTKEEREALLGYGPEGV
ncbi:MAG: type II toxin-antitoxin system VapB family antitoxin [Fimbriimonas sp.]